MGASSLHEWLHPPPGQAKNERWDLEDLLVLVRMWQNGDVGDVAPKGEWIKRNCRSYMTHEFSNYIAFMGLELQYLIRRAKFLVREYDLDLLFSTPLYSGWITRKVRFLKRKPMWTFDKHLRGFPNMEITLNSVKKGRSPAPGPHYTGSEINGRCNMSPKWDLTIVNWLLVIADFKILQHNVNEALVTYEIDYCLLPSLEKLFENASKWPSLPLTFKSIKESDVGLLRWLLMSYGGAALWNEYATMVSNKIVKTTLDAVDEGRFNHRQIPSDFKERVDWLYYYWGMLQEDMFFDRIGGPLLNSEKDRKRRNDVLKRAHGISTFVSDNEENLVLSQDELLMWVWKALSKVEEALNRSGQHHSRIGLPPKLQGMKDAQRSELEFKLASWPRKAVKAVSAKQDKTPEAQGHCNHANNHALGLGRKLTTNDQRIQRSISSIVEGIGAMESSLSTISNESQIKEGRNSLASQISRTEHPYEPDANPYSSISRADVRKEALQRFPEVETRYQNYGKVSMTSKVLKASNIEGMRKYESMVNLREIQKREAEKQAQGQRELEAQKRKQQELERKGKRERKESEKQALQQSEAQRQREFEQRREKERMAAEVMEKFETELLAGAERARAREQEKKAAQQREAKESASLQLKPAAQVKPSGYANHAPPASHASHGTHANQHFPPAESQASASKQPKTHQRYSPPTFLLLKSITSNPL
ncbi:hypothetical protein G7Y89_g15843 [Cudoniella acicularis]|uniref:Uncharacterized protein n=1 Tax=Cudoniella acicularis TaxID=354080 RepID=A0A8H4VHR0_9HELO|nr:hypothetical protein G7Y89_g15843 [Cudoniella acicularis]